MPPGSHMDSRDKSESYLRVKSSEATYSAAQWKKQLSSRIVQERYGGC